MEPLKDGSFLTTKQFEDIICKVGCVDVIQNDVQWIRKELTDFKEAYDEGHKDLVERVNKTNGSVAEITRWKERATGAFVVINAVVIPILLYIIYLHIGK